MNIKNRPCAFLLAGSLMLTMSCGQSSNLKETGRGWYHEDLGHAPLVSSAKVEEASEAKTHVEDQKLDPVLVAPEVQPQAPADQPPASPKEMAEGSMEMATVPTPVGGAFLACRINHEKSSVQELALACSFDSMGLPATRANDIRYSFVQGALRDTASALEPASQTLAVDEVNRRWNWDIRFSRPRVLGPMIFVDVFDRVRSPSPIFSTEISLQGTLPQSFASGPMHFGDALFTRTYYSNLCTYNMAATRDVGIREAWIFEVTSPTAVIDINLDGICGIGIQNNLQSTLRIFDAQNNVLNTLRFDRNVPNPSLKGVSLSQGVYTIVVRANRFEDDADDFLINKIVVQPIQGFIIRR